MQMDKNMKDSSKKIIDKGKEHTITWMETVTKESGGKISVKGEALKDMLITHILRVFGQMMKKMAKGCIPTVGKENICRCGKWARSSRASLLTLKLILDWFEFIMYMKNIFKIQSDYLKNSCRVDHIWLACKTIGSSTMFSGVSDPRPNLTNVFAITCSPSQVVITRNVPTLLE